MTALPLDRMELDDGRPDPVRLAAVIHRQLGDRSGAVPIREIARTLGIVEIREAPLKSFEGALLTGPERYEGKILVNRTSSPQRRRFTVAHELLHFLNVLHTPTTEDGFECRQGDLAMGGDLRRTDLTKHQLQEVEANRFAIELLAPLKMMKPFLRGEPEMEKVVAAATALDLSKEAASRRYIELHGDCLGVVFSKDGCFLYSDWSDRFPYLQFKRGDRLPVAMRKPPPGDTLSNMDEVDAADWLQRPYARQVYAQTLMQKNGHATTMLLIETNNDSEAA